jgi:hypothetical protein
VGERSIAGMSDPTPDNTLPGDLPDDEDDDLEIGNQLPDDPSQDEANRNRNRGKSDQAPGHNKPQPR